MLTELNPRPVQEKWMRCEYERRQLVRDLELTGYYDPRRAALASELEASNKRIQELNKLLADLQGMKDAGKIHVIEREGLTVLQLPEKILFPSGRAELTAEGKRTTEQLAELLKHIEEHQLMVTGHTDDRPLASSSPFDTNWELSTQRAVSVVKALASRGVPAPNLAAAGYAEHAPVAPNESEDGRAQNRRTEIVLMPHFRDITRSEQVATK